MNTAIIKKETEKALQVKFGCDIYDTCLTVTAWIPKSLIKEIKRENDKLYFDVKNDWILDAKAKDYVKYLDSVNCRLSQELSLYISGANNEKVEYVYA